MSLLADVAVYRMKWVFQDEGMALRTLATVARFRSSVDAEYYPATARIALDMLRPSPFDALSAEISLLVVRAQ